ncbi:MAG: hypothetical protein Q4E35_07225 [Eubacteriales bacterium]|nr:hypothetical protein [Eubacteriales bacterium]
MKTAIVREGVFTVPIFPNAGRKTEADSKSEQIVQLNTGRVTVGPRIRIYRMTGFSPSPKTLSFVEGHGDRLFNFMKALEVDFIIDRMFREHHREDLLNKRDLFRTMSFGAILNMLTRSRRSRP